MSIQIPATNTEASVAAALALQKSFTNSGAVVTDGLASVNIPALSTNGFYGMTVASSNKNPGVALVGIGAGHVPGVVGYSARGTPGTLTPTGVGDSLAVLTGVGFDGTIFPTTSGGGIRAIATENYTPTAQGAQTVILTTPTGTTTARTTAFFRQNGDLVLNTTGTGNGVFNVNVGGVILAGQTLTAFGTGLTLTSGTLHT